MLKDLYSRANPSSTDNKNGDKQTSGYTSMDLPSITLPKGGGSIRSIDEKFTVNAVNGSAGISIPFPLSPSRNSFAPSPALSYNSGSGNGIFGLGWSAEPASISRKTDKKLPEYKDADESDIFLFSGAEDLVPVFTRDDSGNWIKNSRTENGTTIVRYRPRIESGFARIEKITGADGITFWKVTDAGNIVSVFGRSESARIADPADPVRIFKWLLEFSYDDKGNCFRYEYKKEDKVNVPDAIHEKNRLNDFSPCTNTYLKSVQYCNKDHFNRSSIDLANWDNFLNNIEFLLELVLDYGEHDAANPQPGDDKGWLCRSDAFSEYRSGFEIRTRRLCRRVLMFHRFSELGTTPCLVRSLDLTYDENTAFTFLKTATQKGYIRKEDNSYSQKSMPPVEFTYEQVGWNTEIRSLTSEDLENCPTGIDDTNYRWIDLYQEGISGILTEQANAWYYKSNAGGGHFEGLQLVSPKPSLHGVTSGQLHFADLEAKGQRFLVSNELNGYYELSDDNEWMPFKNFTTFPRVDLHDPNLKMLDLNGDGMTDLLVSEEQVFTWYISHGKEGFDAYHTSPKTVDEEKGPAIIFADSTESIVLADMSGDGLADIVRIRYSEVVYWPNLGYGKFGAKVTMSNAPVFDLPENFNPKFVKLADIDGSGTTDIVYLGQDTFKIYFNQGGNSWSEVNLVNGINPLPFPKIDDHTSVAVLDLLGHGTGCIVWSSPMPGYTGNPLRYIDLMGGKKPHLMIAYKNNMGKEVFTEYKSSTFFYLQDKKAGTPWITKLPFPVQCVSQVIMTDQVRKSRFTNQYTYHHGYYDHFEREFRGFGRVDQTDTEDFAQYKKVIVEGSTQIVDEGFHQPPVLTKTWFHTGAFIDSEKILDQFAHEYYQNTIIAEQVVQDNPLPSNLTTDEWREALRACKGLTLRSEVYSPDGSDKQDHPYSTANSACFVKLLQPQLQNAHAVFLVQESESLTYTYERNPADPRISQNMTIETDEFGNVLKAASVTYGRKVTDSNLTPAEQAEQSKTHIIFSGNQLTNKIDTDTDYRVPSSYNAEIYELTGLTPATGDYFSIDQLQNEFEQAEVIPYEAQPTAGTKQKRLIEHTRTIFLKNDQSAPLPLGSIESLALTWQTYRLAMTPGLRDFIFNGKVSDDLLLQEGKYVHVEDNNYWIASGIQQFDSAHFYQVTGMTDPFGFNVQISYDPTYRFFVRDIIDALDNQSTVIGFNYRTLTPWLIQDLNDNRTGIRADELGMVVSNYTMGKEEENVGDFIDITTAEASANDHPNNTNEYDLFNYYHNGKPNFIKKIARTTHYFDSLQTGQDGDIYTTYVYVCGGGNPVMQKLQTKPGIALQENADGTVTEVDTTPNPRWIGNGRALLNNKGQVVKSYDPYFSTTFEFEDAKELVERGVTPLMYYDSAGRLIRTDLPDGTFSKVEFTPWLQRSFDRNDTVLESQWYKDRIIDPIPGIATPEDIAAATKAAAHAHTPTITHLDSMGRNFFTVSDNGAAGTFKTSSVMDIEGNLRNVTDAAGNVVMQYKYDMLGAQLYHTGMDTGERWVINDVMGKLMRSWDSRQHQFRYEYDILHRPVKLFMQQGTDAEINTEHTVYGESLPDAKTNNLRGRSYQHFDMAGKTTNRRFDFKGNGLQGNRQFLQQYKGNIDWNILTEADLEEEVFESDIAYDALNRPLQLITPGNNTIRPVYTGTGQLNEVFASIKGLTEKQFVKDINYNGHGQREDITYGNNTKISYQYDPKNFRLKRLTTRLQGQDAPLQDFQYAYDPVGNTSFIKDHAQPDVFFNGAQVKAENNYVYDALYQLIEASGREHISQNNVNETNSNNNFRNFPFEKGTDTNTQALRNYTQQYTYDAAGNMRQLKHMAGAGSYTRDYQYNNNDADRAALGIDANSTKNNQLLATTTGTTVNRYQYDAHGNMLNQPHLQNMQWNYRDELQQIDLGGGGTAYYMYDSEGSRVRKIIERLDGTKEERIYLKGFELYRKSNSAGVVQEATETIHLMDDSHRTMMVETKTIEEGTTVTTGNLQPLTRYQYSNYQDSSCMELDENGAVISYEEYHPYGTTSFESYNKDIRAAFKRYRYTGMERDEESGLEYHNARYYLPWLGRWMNPDPSGIHGGMNLYEYAKSNPILFSDTGGQEPKSGDHVLASDIKDHVETGTLTETEVTDDYITRTKTISGYGWVDIDNGMQKKVTYNLVEMTIYDRNLKKDVDYAQTVQIFDDIEHQKRHKAATMADIMKELELNKAKSKEQQYTRVQTFKKITPPKPDSHPIFNRVIGGLKAVGAYLEIAGGYALCSTGLGCVLGLPLILHGIDSAISAARSLYDGENHRTFTSEYLLQKGLGLNERGAEAVDMAIGLLGGLAKGAQKIGQWGLKPLREWAAKQSYKIGQVPGNAVAHTSFAGEITLAEGLTKQEAINALTHEGTHRFLSPVGTSIIQRARQGLKALSYNNSHLLRWAEEGIAYSSEFGSWSNGFKMMSIPVVGRGTYGLSRTRLVLEGTGVLGGYFYGTYKLSGFLGPKD